MRVILTGGSGDMGGILARDLLKQGDDVVILDLAVPHVTLKNKVDFIKGSITDRDTVKRAMHDIDCVVHIAAFHGIHEEQGKTAYDFHDLNVTGTLNVFQAAADAGVKKVVLISSTSTSNRYDTYGHTKILNEEMARAYAHRHDMDILTLRPRGFIPPWNRSVYDDFTGWANWFVKGAVHIFDVCDATLKAVNFLKTHKPDEPAQILTIDGAYEYSVQDIENWSDNVPAHTYGGDIVKKAKDAGINIERCPSILGSDDAEKLIGYNAQYSLKNLLDDFVTYGQSGPPNPLDGVVKRPSGKIPSPK